MSKFHTSQKNKYDDMFYKESDNAYIKIVQYTLIDVISGDQDKSLGPDQYAMRAVEAIGIKWRWWWMQVS